MKHWVDRVTAGIAPRWTLRRLQARLAVETLLRHYEASASGRRTQGWKRNAGDANVAVRSGLVRLREVSRDLVRNNSYATSALDTIVDHAVGWGITTEPESARVADWWARWADTTACDAEGRQDLAGLQKLVMRTIVESGEVLVRRRWRRAEDGLPIPMQLQVLEPDLLDAAKEVPLPGGGQIVQGVEFDAIGRRIAYWLFPDHPGATLPGRRGFVSERIPARDVVHVFKPGRPGQVRGVSWFAPVTVRLKDFDDYEDASLMKQKIAACLAVLTSDLDGTAPSLGTTTAAEPTVDSLEPGMILNVPPGRSVSVVQPPTVSEHDAYAKTVLRAIASGLGLTYEDLTGDYQGMPFSAARMSRLRHWARVEDWRWRILIPQFCDPTWRWAMEAADVMGLAVDAKAPEWTAPPPPMIEPDREALAYTRAVRSHLMSLSEALRERGYRSKRVLQEIAADNALLDELGLISDADPRKTTQAGQPRESAGRSPESAPAQETVDAEEGRAGITRNGAHR